MGHPKQPTEAIFLRDVEKHRMRVLSNNGFYRHVRFQSPENSAHWFELVTWPHCLTIHGDMGTWTFTRVEDMFTFFRGGEAIRINPSYWAEKICRGLFNHIRAEKVFDAEVFRSRVYESLEGHGLAPRDLRRVKSDLKEHVFSRESEHEIMEALYQFESTLRGGAVFSLDCTDLPSAHVYGYHFIWCLYAIVWGIQQWDRAKKPEEAICT